MAEKKADILVPKFDGALIDNKYVKAGLFVTKTRDQRNSTIRLLYRDNNQNTTTLCYVSADKALYELTGTVTTEDTTDSDWTRLDFGVSDILIAKGTWNADNTTPALLDASAIGNGNDFYVVTGAATPTQVQVDGLFGGQEITVKDGDWIISNGVEWFNSSAPINWDSISGRPTTIDEYVAGQVIGHVHDIDGANGVTGLQAALNAKFDIANVGDHTIDWSTVPDSKLVDAYLVKTNYYSKQETYNQSEIDQKIGATSPLTTKGDILTHNGTDPVRKAIGTNGYIMTADDAIAEGWKWSAPVTQGWEVQGETVLTALTTINQNGNGLLFKMGNLSSNGGLQLVGDLGTATDTSLLRFSARAAVEASAGFTDIYLGAANGNAAGAAWGNIMIGQNNATAINPTGEWNGGRNIMIGNNIANQFNSDDGTHNVFIGRKVANNSGGSVSYTVAMGYEAYADLTIATIGAMGSDVAIGSYAMKGYSSVGGAGADDENIAIGLSAMQNASTFDAQGGGVNITIGKEAGLEAEFEYYNILIGWKTGYQGSFGRGNIGLGAYALANSTGAAWGNINVGENTYNTAVGVHALQHVRGNQNVALGVNAFSGYSQQSPSVIGNYNIAIGADSAKIVTGSFNSFFGGHAGARFGGSETGGTQNTATLVGDYNTFIGGKVTWTDGTPAFSNSVVIGSNFGQAMVSDKIYLGSPSQDIIINKADVNEELTQVVVREPLTGQLYVKTGGSGGIPEAPTGSGVGYVRQDSVWANADTKYWKQGANGASVSTQFDGQSVMKSVSAAGSLGFQFQTYRAASGTYKTFLIIQDNSWSFSAYNASGLLSTAFAGSSSFMSFKTISPTTGITSNELRFDESSMYFKAGQGLNKNVLNITSQSLRIYNGVNLQLGETSGYGDTVAGQGVFRLNDATIVPTGTITNGGGLLYVSGTSLYFLNSAGVSKDLAGGWALTGTTTLTGAVDVQGGANEIKLSGSALVAGIVQVDSWLSIDNNALGTHSIELKNQSVGAGQDSLGGLRISPSNFAFLEYTDNNDATKTSFVEVYSGNVLFSVNDDRVTFDGVKMFYNQTPTITASNDIITKGYADSAYQPKATGTPDGTKFLRDDGVWAVP